MVYPGLATGLLVTENVDRLHLATGSLVTENVDRLQLTICSWYASACEVRISNAGVCKVRIGSCSSICLVPPTCARTLRLATPASTGRVTTAGGLRVFQHNGLLSN